MSGHGVYPSLPQNGETFRLTTCMSILEKMDANLAKEEKSKEKAEMKHSRLRTANVVCTSLATGVSAAGAITSGTGPGIVVGVPLVGVGALLGAVSLITLKIDKEVVKKLVKLSELISLANAKLSSVRDLISKAMNDGKISEEEFRLVNHEYSSYEAQRREIIKVKKSLEKGASMRDLKGQVSELVRLMKEKEK